MSTSQWVSKNTTLAGKPFSFEGYEFQKAILDDMHENMCVVKISQTGLTEISIRKALAFLERHQGTTGIFTFPDQPMRDKNAKTRFKPIITKDEVFNKPRDKDSVRAACLYQLGLSFLHVTDCTEGAATSTPADILIQDEIDLADQHMLALFQSRLENSNWQISQRFSTPTHIQFGIDAAYIASDQREYLLRCECCGHYDIPDFTPDYVRIPGLTQEFECFSHLERHHIDGIDLDLAHIICQKCGKQLNLREPSLREWVARKPDRVNNRGYRVRPFSTSRRTIKRIIMSLFEYKDKNYIRGWWNTTIGKAYTAGDERLSTADINACLVGSEIPNYDETRRVAVGIDVGIVCHVTVIDLLTDNPIRFETVQATDLIEHVRMLCSRYNVVIGGMDRHPQTVLASEVWNASGGRIWPIEYRGTKNIMPVRDALGEVTHYQCDRTAALDRVAVRVRSRKMRALGYGNQKDTITLHLTNMVREEEPEKPAVWKKIDDNDHYFHALGFAYTAVNVVDYLGSLPNQEVRTTVGLIAVPQEKVVPLIGRKSNLAFSPLFG